MLRAPSKRRNTQNAGNRLNLIPILDAVFIFIFFLLMSASFIKIFEINSDVPMISDSKPPIKKPLALTLNIKQKNIEIAIGVPSRIIKAIDRGTDGFYDLESLHQFLVELKEKHKNETTAIFEPIVDLTYEELVKIMDSVRVLRNTDKAIFRKDRNGLETKITELFNNIVFGNIQS